MIQVHKSLRKIIFTSEVSQDTITTLVAGIDQLIESIHEEKELSDITIIINSSGGDPYASFAFFDYVEEINNDPDQPVKINTKGFGMVASAATMMLNAGRNISISKRTTWMWHNISQVKFGLIGAGEMKRDLEDIENVRAECDRILSSRIKISEKTLGDIAHSGHDYRLTGEELTKLLKKQPEPNPRAPNPNWKDPNAPREPAPQLTTLISNAQDKLMKEVPEVIEKELIESTGDERTDAGDILEKIREILAPA